MSKETREYAKQLVSQMTLEEKMSQMVYQSPAIVCSPKIFPP